MPPEAQINNDIINSRRKQSPPPSPVLVPTRTLPAPVIFKLRQCCLPQYLAQPQQDPTSPHYYRIDAEGRYYVASRITIAADGVAIVGRGKRYLYIQPKRQIVRSAESEEFRNRESMQAGLYELRRIMAMPSQHLWSASDLASIINDKTFLVHIKMAGKRSVCQCLVLLCRQRMHRQLLLTHIKREFMKMLKQSNEELVGARRVMGKLRQTLRRMKAVHSVYERWIRWLESDGMVGAGGSGVAERPQQVVNGDLDAIEEEWEVTEGSAERLARACITLPPDGFLAGLCVDISYAAIERIRALCN